MTNPNDNFNPVFNNPLPLEFAHWSSGLDYDDDEFRAGYPFSDLPEMELNESWKSHDSSSTFDNNVDQLNNSSDDGCISTRKEDEQITSSSSEQQEKTVDVQLEFNLIVEHGENQQMDSNQLNNYREEERDGDHQYDSVDKDKEINVEKFEPLHQVETNE